MQKHRIKVKSRVFPRNKIINKILMRNLQSFYDKFIRCKMLKRPISLAIQSDRRSIDVRREAALAQADVSGGRHIGFLSPFFFSYLLRGESICSITRPGRRTSSYYSILRPFAKSCSKMRYRVIVKRHVARFAAAWRFDVDKVSRETFFFGTFFPRAVVKLRRNPRY